MKEFSCRIDIYTSVLKGFSLYILINLKKGFTKLAQF